MRDGRLILKCEEGEVKDIYINANLDYIYKKMFLSAKKSIYKNPENPKNGIKAIIFGTFYIEAICNSFYKEMLTNQIKKESLAKSIWETTKRIGILDKISIATSASSKNTGNKRENISLTKRIFDLRNRLAHFKDEDWEISDVLIPSQELGTSNDLDEMLKNLNIPEPKIIQELTGERIINYIEDISKIEKYVKNIFKEFIKENSKSINWKKYKKGKVEG